MEKLTNLSEYRNERIRAVQAAVQDAANEYLQTVTSAEYAALLGHVDVTELELFVIEDTFDTGLIPAPAHIQRGVGIAVANALANLPHLPYTVDLSTLAAEKPYIRIVKM
jgi:hypothetical protein